jgi:hypothetical protein
MSARSIVRARRSETPRALTSDGSRLTKTGLQPRPPRLVQLRSVLQMLVLPLPSGPSTMIRGASS